VVPGVTSGVAVGVCIAALFLDGLVEDSQDPMRGLLISVVGKVLAWLSLGRCTKAYESLGAMFVEGSIARWYRAMLVAAACVFLATTMVAAANAAPPGPTLTLDPTSAGPTAVIRLSGSRFPSGMSVTVAWDGSTTGMPTTSTLPNGSFRVWVTIPTTATLGKHVLQTTAGATSASAAFQVITPTPSPTAIPASTVTSIPTPSPTAGSSYVFGTLLTDQSKATQEYAANVRVVELELGWDLYEPQDGVFSTTYSGQARTKLQAFQAAGLKVVLGVGLQYPPSWVFNYANSHYVNQFGSLSGEVNLTFNQALRLKAEQYIAKVAQDLGPTNFWAIRIGSGGSIESVYPDEQADGIHSNGYWGYDAAAQGGAGLPPMLVRTPFPGWLPGQTTYNAQAFTISQVQRWYDWYLGAMVDGINWQVNAYKADGYTGYLQVLMSGLGSRPDDYVTGINNRLNGTGDGNLTMGRAAVWNKVVDALATRQNVVIYVSSMADGSGSNDLCQSSDASVALSDPSIDYWSATRWISYNANRYGMLKTGENPGYSPTIGYGKTMMQTAAQQMQACRFQGLMWAHDVNLYDGTSGVTLIDYMATIAQYSP
jgi:hypothetical protein